MDYIEYMWKDLNYCYYHMIVLLLKYNVQLYLMCSIFRLEQYPYSLFTDRKSTLSRSLPFANGMGANIIDATHAHVCPNFQYQLHYSQRRRYLRIKGHELKHVA